MNDNLDERKTFVSSKGVVLNLRPVSQFKLDALRTSTEEIPVPQYTMTIAGGEKISHPMDEIIAKNQGRMDEWIKYKQAVHEQNTLQSKRFTELVISEGVELEIPDKDSEWQKNMEHFGILVPEEPIARKLHYIFSETLVGGEDIAALISQILSVSQISEEAVAKIRNSFRTQAQRDTTQRTGKNKRKVAERQPDV
jgi:hypothetical protein